MTATGIEQAKRILTAEIGEKCAAQVLDFAVVQNFPAQTTIVQEEAPLDSLYLILDGTVSITIEAANKSLLLGHLGPAAWFGEIALFSGTGRASSSVTADSPVHVLEISHEAFTRMRSEKPAASAAILRVIISGLAERVRASDAAIAQHDAMNFELRSTDKPEAARSLIKSILRKLTGVAERRDQ